MRLSGKHCREVLCNNSTDACSLTCNALWLSADNTYLRAVHASLLMQTKVSGRWTVAQPQTQMMMTMSPTGYGLDGIFGCCTNCRSLSLLLSLVSLRTLTGLDRTTATVHLLPPGLTSLLMICAWLMVQCWRAARYSASHFPELCLQKAVWLA